VGDRPLLLGLAPQCKGDRASAEDLILPFSGEDVLKLDVTQTCLPFGDEIVDRLIPVTAALDDDLPGGLIGVLRLGNGEWNLAFFLLRTFVRSGFLIGSSRLGWSGTGEHSDLTWDVDSRFMAGEYVSLDGRHFNATFGFL